MWHWLNGNSGAMQAIATFVLVIITARYVSLTKGLAEAANAESLRQKEGSNARRRELASQIGVLRSALDLLPNPKNFRVDKVIHSVGWEKFDFGAFRKLASEVSDSVASSAATVEAEVQRMGEIVKSLKLISDKGFRWDDLPQVEWDDAMRATQSALTATLAELSSN
jgi:hypothetical protein